MTFKVYICQGPEKHVCTEGGRVYWNGMHVVDGCPACTRPVVEVEVPIKEKKTSSLTLAQGIAYKKTVEEHFITKMPFRKSGYTVADLARETGIPVYQLSAFIHQEYGRHFSDFINDARFEYLNKRMQDDPRFFQYSLEALARDAGFNSRTSFINAVRKRTGKTPSESFVPSGTA